MKRLRRKPWRWCGLGVAAILLVAVLWPASAPLELTLTNEEPSGVLDEEGRELSLVSLCIGNTDRVRVMIEKDPHFEINAGGRWKAVAQPLNFGRIDANGSLVEQIVVPANATGCRLRLRYQTETWRSRLHARIGDSGRRRLLRIPWLCKMLWVDSWNTFPNPPRWREADLTIQLGDSRELRRTVSQ